MALQANALVTLEDTKEFIGIESGDTSLDFKLEIYINALSNLIERITKRKLKAADYTERYQGTDEQELLLNQYPINSVERVEYIENNVTFFTFEDIEYEILSEYGVLFNPITWYKVGYSTFLSHDVDHPLRYIEVEYNAGYVDVPVELQLIVYQCIDDNITIDENGSRVLKSFAISDTKWVWKDGRTKNIFSASQMETIKTFRKIRL